MSDLYDSISPADYRYRDDAVAEYLSENGFTMYKLRVEAALVEVLAELGICTEATAAAVRDVCSMVTTAEVYAEEKRIGHDIRALVNCIQARLPDEAKPYVHMGATSYDIVDTANAARFKDVTIHVVLPAIEALRDLLAEMAGREAETVQVARTHGQHAVPITFGLAIAWYVTRLEDVHTALSQAAHYLVGKFSGAAGAYNATSLIVEDPLEFERRVLNKMGLTPATLSTQIVPPEQMIRLLSELLLAAGVMANLARDMRNLQRSEIGEVGEEFGAEQVGSSTMPQKRNPINFENSEGMWKELIGRMVPVYMDQVSEHQRDLTGSASGRTNPEIVNYVVSTAKRLTRTMRKLRVDRANLERNLAMGQGSVLAEPAYILLAKYGHPDAHEAVRRLTLVAQTDQVPLQYVVGRDEELKPYLSQMTEEERAILADPNNYTGLAANRARFIAEKILQPEG